MWLCEREGDEFCRLAEPHVPHTYGLFCTSYFTRDQTNASDFLYKLKGIIIIIIISLGSGDLIHTNPRVPDLMGLYPVI